MRTPVALRLPLEWEQRMKKGPGINQAKIFQQRLIEEAQGFKEAAEKLPPGTAREPLMRSVRQVETAAHIDDWLNSPGLRPPTAVKSTADRAK